MVYRKYREIKQWGKVNTRIFKNMVRNQEYKRMPAFTVPEALQQMDVEIHDPNVPRFFEKRIPPSPDIKHAMFRTPKDEVKILKFISNLKFLGSSVVQVD
jgi:hypothetical protein